MISVGRGWQKEKKNRERMIILSPRLPHALITDVAPSKTSHAWCMNFGSHCGTKFCITEAYTWTLPSWILLFSRLKKSSNLNIRYSSFFSLVLFINIMIVNKSQSCRAREIEIRYKSWKILIYRTKHCWTLKQLLLFLLKNVETIT